MNYSGQWTQRAAAASNQRPGHLPDRVLVNWYCVRSDRDEGQSMTGSTDLDEGRSVAAETDPDEERPVAEEKTLEPAALVEQKHRCQHCSQLRINVIGGQLHSNMHTP